MYNIIKQFTFKSNVFISQYVRFEKKKNMKFFTRKTYSASTQVRRSFDFISFRDSAIKTVDQLASLTFQRLASRARRIVNFSRERERAAGCNL